MSEKYFIGVDIGTQGTKAAIYDADGFCISSRFVRSKLYCPKPGVVEEDPEFQITSVCRGIRQVVRESGIKPSYVTAIGIDGQMAGIIGIGKNGLHITPYDSWLDTRCATYITIMQKMAGDEILGKTGCSPSINHGPKILWWMHERKSVFKRIASFVQPGGYAAMRLCGLKANQAFIDTTYLHFSGFADNKKSRWNANLCDKFKLDIGKLPAIIPPESIVGELSSIMARKCGLPAGIPLVAGCGDTAASFLACGATKAGICVDVAGTASVFAATATSFRPDKKYRTLACGQAVAKGLWHPYAYINGGGMNLEWFRKNVCSLGCEHKDSEISFDQLNKLAAAINESEQGPLCVPHLGGRVCPSRVNMLGAWVGLNWNHRAEHLYKAILEGVALEYGIYVEILRELYPELSMSEMRVTGGGEKSDLWNQLKSAVTDVPVVQIRNGGGAPMGAAMVAAVGAGGFKSFPEVATQWIKTGQKICAAKSMCGKYKHLLKQYKRLLTVLGDFFDENARSERL
jgi:xylulokinase